MTEGENTTLVEWSIVEAFSIQIQCYSLACCALVISAFNLLSSECARWATVSSHISVYFSDDGHLKQ